MVYQYVSGQVVVKNCLHVIQASHYRPPAVLFTSKARFILLTPTDADFPARLVAYCRRNARHVRPFPYPPVMSAPRQLRPSCPDPHLTGYVALGLQSIGPSIGPGRLGPVSQSIGPNRPGPIGDGPNRLVTVALTSWG